MRAYVRTVVEMRNSSAPVENTGRTIGRLRQAALATALALLLGSPALASAGAQEDPPAVPTTGTAGGLPSLLPDATCLPDPQIPRDLGGPSLRNPLWQRDPEKDPEPGDPSRPTEDIPRFVAYWVATPGPAGCPDDQPCLAVRHSARELLDLILRWRRERGLEIVRFDALVTPSFRLMDLDVHGLSNLPEIILLHDGLVHDGSTSGPPW